MTRYSSYFRSKKRKRKVSVFVLIRAWEIDDIQWARIDDKIKRREKNKIRTILLMGLPFLDAGFEGVLMEFPAASEYFIK